MACVLHLCLDERGHAADTGGARVFWHALCSGSAYEGGGECRAVSGSSCGAHVQQQHALEGTSDVCEFGDVVVDVRGEGGDGGCGRECGEGVPCGSADLSTLVLCSDTFCEELGKAGVERRVIITLFGSVEEHLCEQHGCKTLKEVPFLRGCILIGKARTNNG